MSDYWIGVACDAESLNATLRAQLGLAEGQGLVVTHVVPDSPAAQAGLRENDILLAAGDKPLGKIEDLVAAVDAAKDQELALELFREGDKITIKVTPLKRPEAPPEEQVRWTARLRELHDPNAAPLRAWIEAWGEEPDRVFRMHVPRPGMLLGGAQLDAPLPEGVSVTIVKQGQEPAKITVQRGEESWEVTADKLAELPEDLRPSVEAMLGLGGAARLADQMIHFTAPLATAEAGVPAVVPYPATPAPPAAAALDQQIRDILERLEKLQTAVEELQGRPAPPQP
jgi:hypothetical protein